MISPRARLLLILPATDGLFLVGLFVYVGVKTGWDGWWHPDSLGLLAYNLLSPAALALLVLPIVFTLALVPFAVLGAFVHGFRERRAGART